MNPRSVRVAAHSDGRVAARLRRRKRCPPGFLGFGNPTPQIGKSPQIERDQIGKLTSERCVSHGWVNLGQPRGRDGLRTRRTVRGVCLQDCYPDGMAAPLPKNESERLRRLRRYGILDTPPSPRFDRIARLAGRLLDCPIALISLVDEQRQWFKARVGLEASETGRADAFCAHTILGEDVMVVNDAKADPRFADNPLVVGAPDIRFYAGAPLTVGGGLAMGTLCVIDRKPRELDDAGREVLADLAQIVVDAMEHHRHSMIVVQSHLDLASAHDELRAISDAISHDVRAPLRQLGALLEMFESDHRAALSEDAVRQLGDVRDVRARADEAIRGMTELARLPRDKLLDCEDVNVAPILRELTETMGAFYPEMVLRCDLPERPVRANEVLLRQMLQHLVDNGFKHGGRNVRVEFTFDDVRTRIAVLDDGPGIPAAYAQTVFEPFRRLVPKSVAGTGVGLTVVKRIVEAHGGRAYVEADRIGGSAFIVELPFEHPNADEHANSE